MRLFAYIARYLGILLFLVFLFPDNTLRAGNTSYASNANYMLHEVSRFSEDSLQHFKDNAILAAKNNDVKNAAHYVEHYIKYSAETGFVKSRYFSKFSDTPEFEALKEKYDLNLTWLHFFYLFSALIGFFIGFMLLINKSKDKRATLLIAVFVLIHSLFIFHIFLHSSNLKYRTPHILYMSSIFSYLYGPLLYFYFKRITQKYKFRKIDLLHLLPTVVIIAIMFPLFLLSRAEKLDIMLEVGSFDRMPYLYGIVFTKILSLLVYGALVAYLYFKNKSFKEYNFEARRWLTVLVTLSSLYVISYAVYGLVLANVIPKFQFLFQLQIVVMAIMVLYIGYASFRSPNLFAGQLSSKGNKYVKSGLTPSYSEELKLSLIHI